MINMKLYTLETKMKLVGDTATIKQRRKIALITFYAAQTGYARS